jgi:hypothetical protein
MKKITLLSAVLVAGMATAQVQVPMNMEIRKAEFKSIEMTAEVTMEEWNAGYVAKQKAAAADYAAHDYYFTEGMMHFGYTPQFYGLQNSFIAVPYLDSVVWTNYYGPTSWYEQYNDSLVAENSETYVTGYGIDGSYYLPYTTDHTLTQGDKTYNIKGYKYAAGNENGGYLASAVSPIIISTGEMIPLTLCGMETDPMNNESGSDFYQIGAGARGAYAYGTKLIADTATGVIADTLISTVRNLSPLKISAVNIPVYNNQGTTIMPEGGQVKVELFAADLTTGKIYTDSLLGEAVATVENFLDLNGKMGTISVVFQVEDILGGMMDAPIVVEGDFVLQITGYNESGCNFGIFADYYTPGGTTMYKVGGKYTPIFSASSNLAVSYDAYWPTLVNDTTLNEMNAPVAGGLCHYGEDTEDYVAILYTNVYDVEGAWSIETPEWVSVAVVDTTYLSQAGAVLVAFEAEELPATVEGRKEVVSIDADGFVYDFVITQGVVGDDTAVDNVVAPLFDNKIYNLLGVEVDENYKGIVIKNGQKYIQ